ncbi:hypothetical protein [Tianweitania sediminis]|jgi:hypothetical protein|uniref:Uncharacterized protein n=1 Tax=Tianweitania sediminis TaxID=1502156 RepID=A0A8J7UJ88_9HYPH|nr:hypothetical protein [Tianweitania sediminis]MBP0441034.1 hypothetical protein [Tianweitania sediminis]HEV7416658.1 hypothetical protein [Tianweitania sediminis]
MQKDVQFAPGQIRATQKADATTKAAKSILDAEIAAREAKTERLRQARLNNGKQSGESATPALR